MSQEELEHAPEFCERCGVLYPDLFLVDDYEWSEVIEDEYEEDVSLCENCYDVIRINKGIKKGKRKHSSVWTERRVE